jgi:ferrochelatase
VASEGLLLINLGTPDAPTSWAVRRYLNEFLSDGRVIDIAPWARFLLLQLIILPFRSPRSAAAYRKVWMDEGSPLLVHSRACADGLAQKLAGRYEVALAMRYGQPSIRSAIDSLRAKGITRLTVMPMYPQNAASSTSSSLAEVYRVLAARWEALPIRVIPPFFEAPEFLDAFAQVARRHLSPFRPQHVLFSFHGLPERHLRKSDPTQSHCLSSAHCCDSMAAARRGCYRAQCYFVARALAERLALPAGAHSVSFQSRLGRTPWVRPYTDEVIPDLAKGGTRRLAVMCPAFVADCLETVEEIGIRARESFLASGGEEFLLVPSLNAESAWVEGIVRLIDSHRSAG